MLNISGIKEGVVLDHIQAGKSMEIYKYLGLGKMDCTVAIIKNAPNLENAKKFVDFMTSSEGQSLIGTQLPGANPIRTDVEIADYKVPLDKMNGIIIDPLWTSEHKAGIVEQYQDLYLKIFE